MTYKELSQIRTMATGTDIMIEAAINTVRLEQGEKYWENILVSDSDMYNIVQWAKREGVQFPPKPCPACQNCGFALTICGLD